MSRATRRRRTPRQTTRTAYAFWVALTICALLPLPFVQSLAVITPEEGPLLSSVADHGTLATMEFLSSLFAFTAAFAILMRFTAFGSHLYLLMGIGFCVVGTGDLAHGLVETDWFGPWAGRDLFVSSTYLTSRILLVGLFIHAFLTTSRPRKEGGGWRTRPVCVALVITGLAGAVFLFSLYCLVDLNQSAARPVDLILTFLFVLAVPFAVRHYEREPGPFQFSLVVCLLLVVASQFYVCASGQLFDAPFVAALTLKIGCCIAPLLGVSQGLIHQQRLLEDHRRRQANQAAQLWQQSNTLINANRLLQVQTDQLQRSQQQMAAFVATVAHDLKSPLSAQIGLLEALRYDLGAPEAPDLVERLAANARYSLDFVGDLLELLRAQTALSRTTEAESGAIVEQAIEHLSLEIERTGATIEVEAPLPVIHCDPDRILQVFRNLLGNSLKYVAPGVKPVVHISCETTENSTVFNISDNGIGIEEEDRARIFESFVRLHDRSRYSGTGIGLDIVKRIVEAHGGSVWVKSDTRRGSTFSFAIPRSPVPASV